MASLWMFTGTRTSYTLLFDLPGYDPDSIHVIVESGVLTVSGQRWDHDEKDVDWVMRERSTGLVIRRVLLGEDYDGDSVAAFYDRGVLRVTLPVQEGARRRRIEVGGTKRSVGPASAA